jgi:hypothetical protein
MRNMEDAIEMNTRGGPSARDRHSRTKSDVEQNGAVTSTSSRPDEMNVESTKSPNIFVSLNSLTISATEKLRFTLYPRPLHYATRILGINCKVRIDRIRIYRRRADSSTLQWVRPRPDQWRSRRPDMGHAVISLWYNGASSLFG